MKSTLDAVLAHHGIKGMKWGVRRDNPSGSSGPTPITINAKPGKKIVTTGGKHLPTSEDAKQAAIIKQKARASGPQSLSNDEMRLLVNRMQLEQQYAKLNPKQVTLGEKFLKEYAPQAALFGLDASLEQAKIKYKDTEDPRVLRNLKLGNMFSQQMKNMTPKKSKK